MIGRTISHYQIVGALGQGGMGVVYHAIDVKLGRPVALKFLTESLSRDPEAVQRFEREARSASALNDPAICTIYEIEEVDGQLFIAMELLDGESLSHRLGRGPMPFDEVLEYGAQVAHGLDAAHQRGICHRDIKPANLFLVGRRRMKILDFGLAKIDEPADSHVVTDMRQFHTKPGVIAGTAIYMSPEQALGKPLDQRTDLFSFGLVLYEMATGVRAFSGPIAAVHEAILNRQPPAPSTLVRDIPPEFDRIVERALQKDVNARYQSAAELFDDLKRLRLAREVGQSHIVAEPPRSSRVKWLTAATAGLALIAAAVMAYLFLGRGNNSASRAFLADAKFAQVTDQSGLEASASLAPDGHAVAYASRGSGSWHVYVQQIDTRKVVDLTPDSSVDNVDPAFSPDGRQVAFRSERDGGGIYLADIASKSVRRISNFCHNPAWSPDQKSIVCATERIDIPTTRLAPSPVWILDVASGAKRQLTTTDGVQPTWSPHGDRIAYWAYIPQNGLWTIPAGGGQPVQVLQEPVVTWNPVWSPDGRYLFFSSSRGGSNNLWRIPIDEKSGRVLGAVEPVTTPSSNAGFISFSRDGSRLAYVHQTFARNFSKMRFDRPGDAPAPVTEGAHIFRQLDLAPDGELLAYTSNDKVFVMSVDGTGSHQASRSDAGSSRGPRWSPDGRTIAYYTSRLPPNQIWTVQPDGGGLTQISDLRNSQGAYYPVWSPDGKTITATSVEGLTLTFDLSKPLPDREPAVLPPFPTAGVSFVAWLWSADGSRLAGWKLLSDGKSAGLALYDARTRLYRDLTPFGIYPTWLKDGRTLLFAANEKLYSVDTVSGKILDRPTPPRFAFDFTLSKDERWLYYAEDQREGDVWVITLQTSHD